MGKHELKLHVTYLVIHSYRNIEHTWLYSFYCLRFSLPERSLKVYKGPGLHSEYRTVLCLPQVWPWNSERSKVRPCLLEVAPWVKVLVAKPGDQSSNPGTHVLAGETDSHQLSADLLLFLPHCSALCIPPLYVNRQHVKTLF